MTRVDPKLKDFAERLLAYEGAGVHPDAAFRVCEKLRHFLVILAGVAGFRALLARALALARAEVPALSVVQIKADGSLAGLCKIEAHSDEDQCAKGEVALIAHLLGLLITFIGEPLTLRLVQDVWPQASADGLSFEKGKTP